MAVQKSEKIFSMVTSIFSPSPSLLSLLYSPLSENFQTDLPYSTNKKQLWDRTGQSEAAVANSRSSPAEKSL